MAAKTAKKTTSKPAAKKPAAEKKESNVIQDSVSAGFGVYSRVADGIQERIDQVRETTPKKVMEDIQERIDDAREDGSKQWKELVANGEKTRKDVRKSIDEAIDKASIEWSYSLSLREQLDQAEDFLQRIRSVFSPSKA